MARLAAAFGRDVALAKRVLDILDAVDCAFNGIRTIAVVVSSYVLFGLTATFLVLPQAIAVTVAMCLSAVISLIADSQ